MRSFMTVILVASAGAAFSAPARTSKRKPASKVDSVPVATVEELSPLLGQCNAGTLEVMQVCDPRARPGFLENACLYETSGLRYYAVCSALAGVPGDACATFRAHRSEYAMCRAELARIHAVYASLRGGAKELQAACREMSAIAGKDVCPVYSLAADALKKGESAKAFCAKAGDFFTPETPCYNDSIFIEGVPARCGDRVDCREEAAFVAALRSSDPKACAKSPFCAALTSRTLGACNSYLTEGSRTICGLIGAEVKKAEESDLYAQKRDEAATTEAKRRQEAKTPPPGFKEGQPMEAIPADIQKAMNRIDNSPKAPARSPKKPAQPQQGGMP